MYAVMRRSSHSQPVLLALTAVPRWREDEALKYAESMARSNPGQEWVVVQEIVVFKGSVTVEKKALE